MAKWDLVTELFYNGQWNTARAYARNPVTMTRGRADEQGGLVPCRSNATADNRTGDYNPRYPLSVLYGLAGRNTPIRHRISSDVRFRGEVANWAPDRSENFALGAGKGDSWTVVDGAGVLRRLTQGEDAVESLFRRFALGSAYSGTTRIAASYWPCEDGSGATQLGSALPGEPALIPTGPTPFTPASYSGFLGSLPLPVFNNGSSFYGMVPSFPDTTGNIFYRIALFIPTGHSIPNGQNLFNIYVHGGSTTFFGIDYGTGGTLTLNAVSGTSTIVGTTGAVAFDVDGRKFMLYAELVQNGSDVDYVFGTNKVNDDGTVDSSLVTGTWAGISTGHCYAVSGGGYGTMEGCAFGHVGVGKAQTFMFGMTEALGAYAGETAGDRFTRLCGEQGITGTIVGSASDTVEMGPQPTAGFAELLAEIERTEAGIIFETRTAPGLVLRTRTDLYNQTAALTLDWNAGEVAPPLTPVLDDQNTRNDVTAKRRDGSEATAEQTDGPLNVQDPTDDPEGVGRYKTEVDVNPQRDTKLADLAGWYLRLGTIEEQRFPQVTVDLDGSPGLATDAAAVDIGDRIVIDNLPVDLSADLVSLIVVGSTETVGSHRRIITFNCIPERAYVVAEADGTPRVDTDGTERQAGTITTTQTAITFAITDDQFWTTDAADFPMSCVMGGEEVTVSGIAAPSGSTQLFTVVRSVNGIVKSHADGTKIHPLTPAYAAL